MHPSFDNLNNDPVIAHGRVRHAGQVSFSFPAFLMMHGTMSMIARFPTSSNIFPCVLYLLYYVQSTIIEGGPIIQTAYVFVNGDSVVDSVIHAVRTMDFEDGLRMGVLSRGFWYYCGDCTRSRVNSYSFLGCRLFMWSV